jgi:hypothetical protein
MNLGALNGWVIVGFCFGVVACSVAYSIAEKHFSCPSEVLNSIYLAHHVQFTAAVQYMTKKSGFQQ